MAFYASGTSVQSPVRAESAAAGSTACGFRPSSMDGRGAFVVRRAAGEENHRSGTARNAPGASGTLHPSNCPGGEYSLRLQAVLNGRTRRLSVSRAAGKVRDARDGVLHLRHIRPVARTGGIHGGEHGLRLQTVTNGRTRSLCCASRSREGNRSGGTARNAPGASGTLHPSDCPGGQHGLRLQAVIGGRTRRLSMSRAAGKVRDTRDGVLRLRHIRPVARAGGIHGGECGLRLQAVTNGRTRSLIVRRAAGEENRRSGTARNAPGASGTLHPSNCPGGEHGLRFRPSLVDGRGALPCVAQPGKRIVAVESPGTRRARVVREVVRCIRPIARAANAVCGFRPSSMDGREDFP